MLLELGFKTLSYLLSTDYHLFKHFVVKKTYTKIKSAFSSSAEIQIFIKTDVTFS